MSYRVIQDMVDQGGMFLDNYAHKFSLLDTSTHNSIPNLLGILLQLGRFLNICAHILRSCCINRNKLLFYNKEQILYVSHIYIVYQLSLGMVDSPQGDIYFNICDHMPLPFSKFQNILVLQFHIFKVDSTIVFHMGI